MTTLELLMFGIDPTVHRLAVSRRSRVAGSIVGLAFAVGLAFSGGLSAVAVAAPPPKLGPGGGGAGPEEQACSGRAVGDACTLPNRQLGTCGDSTCNRLDYSGGSPPKAVEEACVVCKPGGGHGAGPSLGSGSGGAPAGEDGGTDAAGSAGPSGSGADSGPGKDPPESSSRCRVTSSQDPLGALALLALLGLGLGLRRRELRESNLVR